MRSLAQLSINPQGVAFNAATGHSYTLNPSGAFILKALQGGHEPQCVVSMVSERYALLADDAERDVTDFVGRLRTLGLM
jgi:hypothetical protein